MVNRRWIICSLSREVRTARQSSSAWPRHVNVVRASQAELLQGAVDDLRKARNVRHGIRAEYAMDDIFLVAACFDPVPAKRGSQSETAGDRGGGSVNVAWHRVQMYSSGMLTGAVKATFCSFIPCCIPQSRQSRERGGALGGGSRNGTPRVYCSGPRRAQMSGELTRRSVL